MATEDRPAVEDIVAAFLLEREEGKNPNVDDWLARYPKDAEVLAKLLSDDTASPATFRRPTGRGTSGSKSPAPRPAASPDAISLGPYEVLEHVSTAGGGTVYRARHREGGHLVALKVLDSRGAIDPRDVERFHREAGMLRALNLVHVVPVLDSGEEGGRFWIAMKWLEGDTFSKLREAVADESHRLHDLRERARLVARVARTFGAIHAYGILHRDVKPTNIMVDTTGEPMIIDFGIAHAPDLPELTATTDQVMGTPRFLAPELLAGGNREVSPRTDVYGLGLCLYEICTGAEVFKQGTRADLFTAIRTTGPLAPRKANPHLSHDLAAVILRAIEIAPARRYSDMTAFADDLERVAKGEAPDPVTLRGAHPALRFVRRHRKRLVAAAVLAAVLIPAAWMFASRELDRAAARRDEATLVPFSWFSPEAFAGGLDDLPLAEAQALGLNPAATPDQRLFAAWFPFMKGDLKEAARYLSTDDDAFASRLFRAHLKALKDAAQTVHAEATIAWQGPRETLVPMTVSDPTLPPDPSQFDATLAILVKSGPPTTPLDHLVLANFRWSLVPNAPDVDTSALRSAIAESIAVAVKDPLTRTAATHLRGVMCFLNQDWTGARDDFSAVLGAQRDALGTRYLLGMTLLKTGDARQARDAFEATLRGLPKDHRARTRLLGHLALARSGTGDVEGALAACREWWMSCRDERQWIDGVVPRVLAAHIQRDHGNFAAARDLLLEAVQEDERFHVLEMRRAGPEATGRLTLWEPALKDLCAIAEVIGNHRMVEECENKMSAVNLQPLPSSPEAYLAVNLGGLRAPDKRPAFIVPDAPKNQ